MSKLYVVTVVKNNFEALMATATSLKSQNQDTVWVIKNGGEKFSNSFLKKLLGKMEKVYIIESDDYGIYDAMNNAFNYILQELNPANSDWIWFLNSGDTVNDMSKLEQSLNSLDADTQKCLLDVEIKDKSVFQVYEVGEVTFQRIANGKIRICHQALIMRKQLITKLMPFDLRYRVASDFDLVLKAFKDSKYQRIENVKVYWEDGGFSKLNLNVCEREKTRIIFRHLLRSGDFHLFPPFFASVFLVFKTFLKSHL